MILILSQSTSEISTEELMDWLEALGARPVRLNGEDLDGPAALSLSLDGETVAARVVCGGQEIVPSEVEAIWFRGWLREWRHERSPLVADEAPWAEPLQYRIRRHLNIEGRRLSDFLFACFEDRPWIGHARTSTPNKMAVLQRAARCGLAVPASLVTTERAELARFALRHGHVITKPIGEVVMLHADGVAHLLYTTALAPQQIAELPERFAPSLFQEQLAKAYELRVFYLAGRCYSMAIFSQLDAQTSVDFRRYNHERPNRTIPYVLGDETAAAIDRLMRELDLDTGSLDLVRTEDGREVFLEVNPVGQFGMVSKPCNYHLERKLAEHILERAAQGRRMDG